MTKLEKIKEAYGISWDLCKDYIDENGYCVVFKDSDQNYKGIAGNQTHFKEDEIEGGQMTHSVYGSGISFRPKSLSGIETNNDWQKIESEDDLPKEEGFYLFNHKDGETYQFMYCPGFKMTLCTHWKPIVKDLPPIY
jgi:hypothetical protein